MAEKSLLIDLDDPRAEKISEILSNSTCKKILSFLSEEELSEKEISEKLNLPMNTINYNIKKLREAGLIEPVKKVWWSIKGKKILRYTIARKKIVIFPRERIKGVIPALIFSLLSAFGIKMWFGKIAAKASIKAVQNAPGLESTEVYASASSTSAAPPSYAASSTTLKEASNYIFCNFSDVWVWFLVGAALCIIVFLIWNWKKL